MEASKRVVFVSFRGAGDGKPRGRRKRALGCVRGFGEPRRRARRTTPNGRSATSRAPVEYESASSV